MLELATLSVTYGSTIAVNDLNLAVDRGEAVALLGANGAGKTSTLRATSRLIESTGTIRFDGEVVSRVPPEELARRGLVHVPEGRRVFGSLSVDDNLRVGETSRARRKPLFGRAEIYDLFPTIAALRTRYGWSLSGGEQQMVAIGRALMASPRLLMLDEPSLGLAPIVVQAVYRALAAIKSEMSILLVEQNAGVALSLCDRGYVLMSGNCILSASSSELSDRDSLLDHYLGHASDVSPDNQAREAADPTRGRSPG